MDTQHAGFTQVLELTGGGDGELATRVQGALERWARGEGLSLSGDTVVHPGEGIELDFTYRRADGGPMSNRAFSGASDRLLERVHALAGELGLRDRGYCLPLPLGRP